MARTTTLALLATLTFAAACAGDRTATDDAAAPAATEGVTEASSADALPPITTAPAEAVAPTSERHTGAEQVPSAADSAAALADDVSPEWKMRARQMAPFSDCMEKTRNTPESVRPTLVEACHRLPDAPKRP